MKYNYNSEMRIADIICQLRAMRGIKRGELAELIGVTDSYMARLEAGIRTPGMKLYLKILDVLEAEIVVKSAPLTVYDVCAKKMKKAIENHSEEKALMITNMVIHMSAEVEKI